MDPTLYSKLAKKGRSLRENSEQRPEIRIGLLADNATQQLVQVLKAAIDERGFFPAVYEAEFDTAQVEVLDDQSGLYRHRPDWAWLHFCVPPAD